MRHPVDGSIAMAFMQRYLSDFEGYPKTKEGKNRFAEVFQEDSVSVEHLEAILKTFDEKFPTLRQIHDVAMNLRPRFESTADQRKEWAREYGAPSAVRPDFAATNEPPFAAMNRKVREYLTAEREGIWPGWAAISWKNIYEAQEALGYPLNSDQLRIIGR